MNIDRIPLVAVLVTVGVVRAHDLLAIYIVRFVSASVDFLEK